MWILGGEAVETGSVYRWTLPERDEYAITGGRGGGGVGGGGREERKTYNKKKNKGKKLNLPRAGIEWHSEGGRSKQAVWLLWANEFAPIPPLSCVPRHRCTYKNVRPHRRAAPRATRRDETIEAITKIVPRLPKCNNYYRENGWARYARRYVYFGRVKFRLKF